MPIRFKTPPPRSLHVLRAASNSLRPAANPTLRTLSRVFPIEHTSDEPIEQAFPVFKLGLSDVVAPRKGLRAARQTSWRYLIDDELSATVSVDNENDLHSFGSFTRGRLSAELARHVIELNNNPRLHGRDIELSLLEIPALRVTAIWIRDDDLNPNNDLLMPVLSDQTSLVVGKLVSGKNFIGALVPVARTLLANDGES